VATAGRQVQIKATAGAVASQACPRPPQPDHRNPIIAVLLVGIATHSRLLQINREDVELVLAMNRLRRAYLQLAPALEPYLSTGHHDNEPGLVASYLLGSPGGLRRWGHFLVNTPTILATVDAALAAAIVVLVARAAQAATTVAAAAGTLALLLVWAVLYVLQRRALDPRRRTTPRFPTPPSQGGCSRP
jgi:hypothetical protein